MAKQERLQSECPPDAHKVYRPAENKLNAIIVVKVEDSELEKYSAPDLCEVLSLMSETPLVLCSDKVQAAIKEHAEAAEIAPGFLRIHEDDTASLTYSDGAISSSRKYVDFSAQDSKFEGFLDELANNVFVIVPSLGMLILRSISTVYPWDLLLAGDFIRQYITARDNLSAVDFSNLMDIRYGKLDPNSVNETNAYKFLRLERKLFLQYPTHDDD